MKNEFEMNRVADIVLQIMEEQELTVEEAAGMPELISRKLESNKNDELFKAQKKNTANVMNETLNYPLMASNEREYRALKVATVALGMSLMNITAILIIIVCYIKGLLQ